CLAGQMRRTAVTGDAPVTVDMRLDAEIVLPAAVAREVEAAAAALTRLTPHPHGLPAWQDYHAAFIERYGPGALVPVLEIINPDTALGFPATFRGSARTLPAPPLPARDERLLALAYATVMSGSDEIILDDQRISDLTGDGALTQVPPHAELFVQVHAASMAAVQRGEFPLAGTGASRAAGTTTGRFLHLLEAADRDRISRAYASLSTVRAGALPVQVSCPPVYARSVCEITRARAAVYMPFSWGAASSLPFLPRLRYRRTVLAPARWNLPASDLPGAAAPWQQWKDAVAGWWRQFRVPAAVYLGEADNLRRLHLDHDMHRTLLRAHLDRRGRA